ANAATLTRLLPCAMNLRTRSGGNVAPSVVIIRFSPMPELVADEVPPRGKNALWLGPDRHPKTTSSFGFLTGIGRKNIASIALYIAVLAPMPNPSEITTT